MKTVCIVGAGPGGVTAAKTLLQTRHFEVTVYEKKHRIGGIWALDQSTDDSYLSPYTPTNLSRFTVSFSDLDWQQVDLDHAPHGETHNGASSKRQLPTFPKAWMVNRYLETYRRKYIPEGIIQCSKTVTAAQRMEDRWRITSRDDSEIEETREFDYLIVASGFFARPHLIGQDVPGLPDATPSVQSVQVMHSSQFRSLDNLLVHDIDLKGKKILMLGGGNSSGETAAAIAMQLSDAQWSPDSKLRERYRDCKVVHVTPRPLYPLPPFPEYEQDSKSYVPLDLKLYDFSRRPKSQASYAGLQTMEVRNMVHSLMQTIVGGDQSDISSALVSRKGSDRESAYVVLTETYSEFVRSGLIDIVSGRVTGLDWRSNHLACATVQADGTDFQLNDVAAVVYSTGYTPCPALDILDGKTKEAVQYDPTSMRLPMILEQWQTMSRDAPSVSFIGFYEGPYWGMMEMQARLTAHRWITGNLAPRTAYEDPGELLKVRQAFKDRTAGAPQFWFSDYLGYLEDIAGHVGLDRNNNGFQEREGTTSPARYVNDDSNAEQTSSIMKELHRVWHDCHNNGLFVPRAAFRAMHGNWIIERNIESAIPTFPSGRLKGTASFHPRFPTLEKSSKVFDLEYLYVEAGDFTTSTGHSMTASRRYVYRYSEAADELSVWFVKPDNNTEVDYLFHNLDFVKPGQARKEGVLLAKGDHLCVQDMYETEYRLPMKGVSLRDFTVIHQVRGPNKDYVSTTKFSRPTQ